MKGDFSVWQYDPHDNDQGVLFQQGRVISDADLTAAERIALNWRTQVGRDVIGHGVAAVPADEPRGFRIERAHVSSGEVHLDVGPGRAWADGVLLYLPADPADPNGAIDRVATYYDPPLSAVAATPADIGDGTRDAVVLEVALEALNGFEAQQRLIEPALGGPDTAERITAHQAFRLVRLGADETCVSILGRLKDGPSGKGQLEVTLQDAVTVPGDCPTVEGGGYSGFEHNLYRIEIAETGGGPVRFKWSPFNGGLVGRGVFNAGTPPTVDIRANRTAILTAGMTEFYLEAVEYDPSLGARRVTYATMATLNSNGELELAEPATFGALPSTGDPVFFRLWGGLEAISGFTDAADPQELRDGIRLVFDAPAGASYRAGDYWTFAVRAGEIGNGQTLLEKSAPEGLELRRVPLAEIEWTAARDTAAGGRIDDCRRRFRPLTNQRVCCTLLVGDGLTSFGDFNSLEEAAAHLPPQGGELCLLPGTHFANLVIGKQRNIRIHGCERRTIVMPRLAHVDQPIIQITDALGIRIETLDLFAPFGTAVDVVGSEFDALNDVRIADCRILARRYGIRIDHARNVTIASNQIWLLDQKGGLSAISLRAVDALVERNRLGVWPVNLTPPVDPGNEAQPDPGHDCVEADDIYGNITGVLLYVYHVWTAVILAPPPQPYNALGGIHLRGGCSRVRLLQNRIDGGAGHGITLGGILPGEATPEEGPDVGPNAPTVTADDSGVFAYVRDSDGNAVEGVTVFLFQRGRAAGQDESAADGHVSIKVASGTYDLAVEPGYGIVEVSEHVFEGATYYVVEVETVEIEVPPDLAALDAITIQDNEIERMAVCGIGFLTHTGQDPEVFVPDFSGPQTVAAIIALLLAPRELVLTTNMVSGLTIRENHIHHNLRIVFNDAIRRITRTVGVGGISLSLVEGATIAGNHIHDNGLSAADPCCGIFIAYGEDVDIAGNQISGNGPLTADYATARSDGIRGGIFVRFASALLLGGETDALQKPALRVTDNRVDQPAGRALTVAAFGPVVCNANSLNSEREGRWSLIDGLFGNVMIINVGGIHRQLLFATAKDTLTNTSAREAATGGREAAGRDTTGIDGNIAFTPGFTVNPFFDPTITELLLPGGETQFNGNHVRMGPRHQAVMSQFILSLDDVGFDGNQCSVFRPDILFANAVCAGNSVRVTDNRFIERTQLCALSALNFAFGITALSRRICMSTTANNQGDHCIFGMSNAFAGGLPVVDDNNLEVFRDFCRNIGSEPAQIRNYVVTALMQVIFAQVTQPVTAETVATVSKESMVESLEAISSLGADLHYANARELNRLERIEGADSVRVRTKKAQLARHSQAVKELGVQKELLAIDEVAAPETGLVIDGRIDDSAGRGREGLRVLLVQENGQVMEAAAKTDASGYFAITLDEEQAAALARQKKVFIRAVDTSDNVVYEDKEAREVTADTSMRVRLSLEKVPAAATDLAGGRVVFNRGVAAETSTPLEDIRGIGPVRAQRLREAGITDVETLLRTPATRLVEIAGMDVDVVRREATDAVRRAGSTPGNTDETQ